MSGTLLVIIYSLLIFFVTAFIVIYFLLFLFPLKSGAPYVPTDMETVKKMIHISQIKPGEKAVDLGSGDGRIVIELAKAGATAYGYEISPALVIHSKIKIKNARLENNAFIYMKNFMQIDFSEFNVIMIYQLPFILRKLETKLKAELKPGTRIVSNGFKLTNFGEPTQEIDNVKLYTVK